MWRGVMKGACGPLAGDTPRIGTKRTNRILGNLGKMQKNKLECRD